MSLERTLAASLLIGVMASCSSDAFRSASSNVEEIPNESLLTDHEAAEILNEIDNICGDTWCEGDFDYSFNTLDCKIATSSCLFEFEYIDRVWGDDDDDEPMYERRYPAACTFEGITSKEDVMRYNRRITYSDKLYDLVSECIDDNIADAYDTFEKIEIDEHLAECASADVAWAEIVRVPNVPWNQEAMIARATQLGSESIFPPSEGELSLEVGFDMGADLSSTQPCAERSANWISWRKAVRINATNEGDEMGTIILLRYDSSWQEKIPEIQIRLGYAN